MKRTTRIAIAAGAIVVLSVGLGTAVVGATIGDDDGTDTPITGPALERASSAALAYTGEGRVTQTEVGDEESYYQVEVTLDDGRQVDVQLDQQFKVVSSKVDSEENDS